MKIYIAARKQEAAQKVATYLCTRQHEIVSSWVFASGYGDNSRTDKQRRLIAIQDVQEVAQAGAMVFLSEPEGEMVRGGKHVEMGVALALNKLIYVIGCKENIFHWHPIVSHFEKMEDLPL